MNSSSFIVVCVLIGIMVVFTMFFFVTTIQHNKPQENNTDTNKTWHEITSHNGTIQPKEDETNISIACWNLQIFGESKASNDTLLNYYASKLGIYDIFIIQEIRDSSGTAVQKLAEKFPEYQYITSSRAGQSSSKEQYAVFYNNKSTLISSYDYQSEYQTYMQRPPLKVSFTSKNWSFTLYTIHTDPDNVYNEFSVLQLIIDVPTQDTIVLGDLNADGNYYDENNIQHFVNWDWVIGNSIDTTVASSSNTYDRIIINNATKNNFIFSGVMRDVNKEQSDHYLVYGYFSNIYE
jgi:deoxyribonuclease-1-like protein